MAFPIIIIRVNPHSFLGASGVILKFIQFFDENSLSKQNSSRWDAAEQMGRRVLRRHTWGYSVCLCPIKGTPGLNELRIIKVCLISGHAHGIIIDYKIV